MIVLVFLILGIAFSQECPTGFSYMENGKVICTRVIEQKGKGYYEFQQRGTLGFSISGQPYTGSYEIFSATGGLGIGPGSACGLNVFANYLYGLKENIEALKYFLEDWKNAGLALALYGLATYLPVAKEVLLGAEALARGVARLSGFNCAQVMEFIKEMNYTDSKLVRMCMRNKLGDDVDFDKLRQTDPHRWYQAYRECLNEANLFDLIPKDKLQKYTKKLSYRENLKCALYGDKKWGDILSELPDTWEEGGLSERLKIIMVLTAPEVEFRANNKVLAKIGGGRFPQGFSSDGTYLLSRMIEKELPADLSEILDTVILVQNSCADPASAECSSAVSMLRSKLDNFERKWGVDLEDVVDELEVIGTVQARLVQELKENPANSKAFTALQEFTSAVHNLYFRVLKKKVVAEIRKQLLKKYDDLIAYLRTKKRVGSSGECPS